MSLPPKEDKIQHGYYIQNTLDAIFLLASLIIKVPRHSLEAEVIHLTNISIKNAAVKETNSQTSVMAQMNLLSNENLEKLTRGIEQLTPESEKQYWKSTNCCLNKKERTQVWTK